MDHLRVEVAGHPNQFLNVKTGVYKCDKIQRWGAIGASLRRLVGDRFFRFGKNIPSGERRKEEMMEIRPRVLFLLKRQEIYGNYTHGRTSGLLYSAQFVSDMLNDNGFPSKVVIVTDNNDIDREVTQFNADVAVIEALWVVPEKFFELMSLHPRVRWMVRIHSEIPFIAYEGIAIEWVKKYGSMDVGVAPNSLQMFEDLAILGISPIYLPNYYPDVHFEQKSLIGTPGKLNVGCFGAIRPLKNQLLQAITAIHFANDTGNQLKFHINSSRIENAGEGILRNLRALFKYTRHELVEHEWMEHHEFLELLDEMDLVMSVSLSETFSIVTADAVSRHIPIVTSPEVGWADPDIQADPVITDDILCKMHAALNHQDRYCNSNIKRLKKYSDEAKRIWIGELTGRQQ